MPEDYLDNLKDIYPDQLLKAYTEGEFVNLTQGTVYTSFSRTKCDCSSVVEGNEELRVGMDFNVTKMSAVIYVLRKVEGKTKPVWDAVDELEGIYDTPAMIVALRHNYPKNPINVYPDASGKSRKTVEASTSDITLLEEAGFGIRVNRKNPFIKDRVMATNAAFDNGWVRVNCDACPSFASNLEQLSYDAAGVPDKTSGLDHLIDAGTYPIAYEMPITRPLANAAIKFNF